ncbi:MAG: sulfatase-like hydrolase/transferase [Pseudomonadota bacterium]
MLPPIRRLPMSCALPLVTALLMHAAMVRAEVLPASVHEVVANDHLASRLLDVVPSGAPDLTTFWRNKAKDETGWFTLDLGASVPITAVHIAPKTSHFNRFDIAIADTVDAGQATNVVATCEVPATGASIPTGLTICPVSATGRYVTITRTNHPTIRIYAVEVNGANSPEPDPDPLPLSLSPIGPWSVFEGDTLIIPVAVTDPDSAAAVPLTTTTNLPGSLSTDPTDDGWTITWSADTTPPGRYDLTITATDTDGLTATETIDIDVVALADRLQPDPAALGYWQFRDQPTLLLGGSDDEAPFHLQEAALTELLDALVATGGNYLRNAMTSLSFDAAGNPVYDEYPQPFAQVPDGRYDLTRPNPAYWSALRHFLTATAQRDIVVQIEVYDSFPSLSAEPWAVSAWNPDNNVNYTYAEAGLNAGGSHLNRGFFEAAPTAADVPALYEHQARFVRWLLAATQGHPHVLYQVANASSLEPGIERHWAEFVQTNTSQPVYVASSRRYQPPTFTTTNFRDITQPENYEPLNDPSTYTYLDISQNGANSGEPLYDNLRWYTEQADEVARRPINHLKLFHFDWATGTSFADRAENTDNEAAAKLWRVLFGGGAAARYHRRSNGTPQAGLGFNAIAQRHIAAARSFEGAFDIFSATPSNDSLVERSSDEAYALTTEAGEVALFFTGAGNRRVELPQFSNGSFRVRWLDLAAGAWVFDDFLLAAETLVVEPTGPGDLWVAIVGGNRGPVIEPVAPIQALEGEPILVALTVSDPDSAGDPLLEIASADVPGGSSLSQETSTDWQWTWTPPPGSSGGYALAISATDSEGGTTTTILELTIYASQPPQIAGAADLSVTEGSAASFVVTVTDSDGPYPLTLTAQTDAPGGLPVETTEAGVFVVTYDAPQAAAEGSPYSFTLIAQDAGGTAATATGVLLVEDDAPPPPPPPPPSAAVVAVGSDPERADFITDTTADGSQNLEGPSYWRASDKLADAWFTVDLGESRIVDRIDIATRGNVSHQLAIFVGDELAAGQVVGPAIGECSLPGGGDPVPVSLTSCPVNATSGRYVTVRLTNRKIFKVFGFAVPPVDNQPPSITGLVDQILQPGTTQVVDFEVVDADGPAPLTVALEQPLPGNAFIEPTAATTYRLTWEVPSSISGEVEATVIATDGSGAAALESLVFSTPGGSAPLPIGVHAAGGNSQNAYRLVDRQADDSPDFSTYWRSGTSNDTAWFTLDLGGERMIDRLLIAPRMDRDHELDIFAAETIEGDRLGGDAPLASCTLPDLDSRVPTEFFVCPLPATNARFVTVELTNRNRFDVYAVGVLELANQPPSIEVPGALSAVVGAAFEMSLIVTDPDGDATTLTINGPESATLSDDGGGNWTWRWTPAEADSGTVTTTATATDAAGAMTALTIPIAVQPTAPPVLTQPPDRIVALGSTIEISIVATEPDGEIPLQFSVASELPNPPTIEAASDLSATIRWATTADMEEVLATPVTVTAVDTSGALGRTTFSISAAPNQPPQIAASPSGALSVSEGNLLTVSFTLDDPDHTLPISLTGDQAALPGGAGLSAEPNGTSATFTWTPPAGSARAEPYVLTVAAADALGGTNSIAIEITVLDNLPPTISAPIPFFFKESVPAAIDLGIADPDGPLPLTIDVAADLPGDAPSVVNGALAYTAPAGSTGGPFEVTITATDGFGMSTIAAVEAYIAENLPPNIVVLGGDATPSTEEWTHLELSFGVTDDDGTVAAVSISQNLPGAPDLQDHQDGTYTLRWLADTGSARPEPYPLALTAQDNDGAETTLTVPVTVTPRTPPNIVLILTDDQGLGDVSYAGLATDIETPALDALAAEGMRLNNFYANSSVCSPTRAAILTGRYPSLVGVPGTVARNVDTNMGYFTPNGATLPELLTTAGYTTALIGKWHLGDHKVDPRNTPNERGFQLFRGLLGAAMDYYTHDGSKFGWPGDDILRLNADPIPAAEHVGIHTTDLLTTWTQEFLAEQATNGTAPFFLQLAYTSPHDPVQPPEDVLAAVEAREPGIDSERAALVALMEHTDQSVAAVVQALKDHGFYDNTVVVYASDNGGYLRFAANNGPYRGGKLDMYEGGIRVPGVVSWPGRITPNSTSDAVLTTMDLYPTLAEIAGATFEQPIDGLSMVDTLRETGVEPAPRDLVFENRSTFLIDRWQMIYALRRGDWKLVQDAPGGTFELYNLASDPYETVDLAATEPSMFGELMAALDAHRTQAAAIPWQHPLVMESGVINAANDTWQNVPLENAYRAPVVIATPIYDHPGVPLVVRIKDATSPETAKTAFTLRLDRVDGANDPVPNTAVHYLVVEGGVYNETHHGIRMEAIPFSTRGNTDHKGNWTGRELPLANEYSQPAVLGGVLSAEDNDFSIFWNAGATRFDLPSNAAFRAGVHVGEASDRNRKAETAAYLAVETGSRVIDGRTLHTAVSPRAVSGVDNAAPFAASLPPDMTPDVVVLTQSGVQDNDGGWAVLDGSDALGTGSVRLVIEEDQLANAERLHAPEHVAYFAIGNRSPSFATTPMDDTATVGSAWSLTLTASDAESAAEELTFVVDDDMPPENPLSATTIGPGTLELSWTPASTSTGSFSISVTVMDGRGGSQTVEWELTVDDEL